MKRRALGSSKAASGCARRAGCRPTSVVWLAGPSLASAARLSSPPSPLGIDSWIVFRLLGRFLARVLPGGRRRAYWWGLVAAAGWQGSSRQGGWAAACTAVAPGAISKGVGLPFRGIRWLARKSGAHQGLWAACCESAKAFPTKARLLSVVLCFTTGSSEPPKGLQPPSLPATLGCTNLRKFMQSISPSAKAPPHQGQVAKSGCMLQWR